MRLDRAPEHEAGSGKECKTTDEVRYEHPHHVVVGGVRNELEQPGEGADCKEEGTDLKSHRRRHSMEGFKNIASGLWDRNGENGVRDDATDGPKVGDGGAPETKIQSTSPTD